MQQTKTDMLVDFATNQNKYVFFFRIMKWNQNNYNQLYQILGWKKKPKHHNENIKINIKS